MRRKARALSAPPGHIHLCVHCTYTCVCANANTCTYCIHNKYNHIHIYLGAPVHNHLDIMHFHTFAKHQHILQLNTDHPHQVMLEYFGSQEYMDLSKALRTENPTPRFVLAVFHDFYPHLIQCVSVRISCSLTHRMLV